jgi:hypothetical protein
MALGIILKSDISPFCISKLYARSSAAARCAASGYSKFTKERPFSHHNRAKYYEALVETTGTKCRFFHKRHRRYYSR